MNALPQASTKKEMPDITQAMRVSAKVNCLNKINR